MTICDMCGSGCPDCDTFGEGHPHHALNTNVYCCICRDRMNWVLNKDMSSLELRTNRYCAKCLNRALVIMEEMYMDFKVQCKDYCRCDHGLWAVDEEDYCTNCKNKVVMVN